MASICTRSKTEHLIFGQPVQLPERQLPTCADIFRSYCWSQKQSDSSDECASVSDRINLLAERVKEVYSRASIPTVEFYSVTVHIKRVIEKVNQLEKYPLAKRESSSFQEKVNGFDKLFDVCTCKCFDAGIHERNGCKCPQPLKIPLLEWDFWVDQKTNRRMYIDVVDKETTMKLQNRLKRRRTSSTGDKGTSTRSTVNAAVLEDILNDAEGCGETDDSFVLEDIEDLCSDDDRVTDQNRLRYPELCKVIDRCKVSNRDTCIIVNAVLKDMQLSSPRTIIDPAKLRRQRQMWRNKAIEDHQVINVKLTCIGFDGKKDSTLVEKSDCKRTIAEEHYTIVSFPDSVYVDHVVPESSKAHDVCKEILSVITETDSTDSLQSIVCDGTNNNTGKNNGIIRKLEEALNRPLQWLVCLLHFNELPFRKIFSTIDKAITTGPSTATGIISSALQFDPVDLPIANFEPIVGKIADMDDSVKKDLSTDQLYFLKACLAVQSGRQGNADISNLRSNQPGNLSHARWLTKANRILRLYMSKDVSSVPLTRIVRFILNVYGPAWFMIKSFSSCQDGAKIFFFVMKQCLQLDKCDSKLVLPVLQNNKYFAHPENILLAAVGDDDINVRKQAVDMIIEARSKVVLGSVRYFDKDKIVINWSASSYFEMIDWTQCYITAPPMLSHLSDDDLRKYDPIKLKQFPCHSQAVERTVKDTSAVSSKVYGHKSRHGMILQTKKCRIELPRVDCKADFH
jgi:hypothetical protein